MIGVLAFFLHLPFFRGVKESNEIKKNSTNNKQAKKERVTSACFTEKRRERKKETADTEGEGVTE
jgi:hypothetical protein